MVVWSAIRFNCGREMANRFAIAPLTTDSSHEDGTATENELEFVRRRAAGGFGATISSAAYATEPVQAAKAKARGYRSSHNLKARGLRDRRPA
jgi:2,4-dienoyl-CoA reductase-like NADH-dependent reductase (Old Yellow Enzyme family)